MTKIQERVLAEGLALPPAARAEVAERLLQSLEEPDQSEIDAEWAAELDRRAEALESGEMKTTPAEEVFARILAREK